jgi:type I restriction enzyme S subunit
LIRLRFKEDVNLDFITSFLNSYVFWSQIVEMKSGSAMPNVNAEKLKTLIIPKLGIKEQNEFVTAFKNIENKDKKNTIFEKIDEVESLYINSKEIINELTHQLDLIKQLRQAFLREAMQGKFVKSTNTKETGLQLLEKIKAEKAQLITEKKLKKEKELPPITEDEIPFEIPEHWAWCRLGEISNIQRGSSPRPKGDSRNFAKSQTSYNWITISDISSFCEGNKLKQTKEHLTEEGSKHSRFVDENEFIIAVSGSTTGKCCLTGIDGYIYDGLAVVKQINKNLPSEFLMNYMTYLYSHINISKSGASFPNINTDFLNNLIYPLPPLHEQEQIVAKLEELMAFCDDLEQSIKESQGYNEKLLQQVLREALQPKEVENE